MVKDVAGVTFVETSRTSEPHVVFMPTQALKLLRKSVGNDDCSGGTVVSPHAFYWALRWPLPLDRLLSLCCSLCNSTANLARVSCTFQCIVFIIQTLVLSEKEVSRNQSQEIQTDLYIVTLH